MQPSRFGTQPSRFGNEPSRFGMQPLRFGTQSLCFGFGVVKYIFLLNEVLRCLIVYTCALLKYFLKKYKNEKYKN